MERRRSGRNSDVSSERDIMLWRAFVASIPLGMLSSESGAREAVVGVFDRKRGCNCETGLKFAGKP